MRPASFLVVCVFVALVALVGAKTGKFDRLNIGVTYRPDSCVRKTKGGDTIRVHYTGMLEDGTVFDSSLERGDPLEFRVGSGMVIQGWDQGLLGMCVGEKRKLRIPAELGYGERGAPPKIPSNANLIFETELMDIITP